MAVIIAFGGLGGIFATTVFRQKDFPTYIPGLWATIGCQVRPSLHFVLKNLLDNCQNKKILMLCCLGLMTWHFRSQNRKLQEGTLSHVDGRTGFYYTL